MQVSNYKMVGLLLMFGQIDLKHKQRLKEDLFRDKWHNNHKTL